MKTSFSDVEYMKKVAVFQAQAMAANPPSIPFRRTKPSVDKESEDKGNQKKLSIKLDPDDEDSDEIQIVAKIFEDGTAEEWIQWRMQFDELVRDMPLDSGEKKIRVAKTLLKGNARDNFIAILTDYEMVDDEMNDDEVAGEEARFQQALEDLGRKYFKSRHAYRRQRNYLRFHIFMMDQPLQEFKAELLRQNQLLRYFPIPDDRESVDSLPDDELLEIVDRAKRIEWQRDLLSANIDPYAMTLAQYYEYLEKLETKHDMDKLLRDSSSKSKKDKDKNRRENENGRPNKSQKKKGNNKGDASSSTRDKACVHCDKWHVSPDDKCWNKKGNEKPNFKNKNGNKETMFSATQMAHVLEAIKAKDKKKNPKKNKRQLAFQVNSDSESESDQE